METINSEERCNHRFKDSEGLACDERCPICEGDNQCRIAKGYLYKGPCWCQEIAVPAHILRSLRFNRFEPACICRRCLEMLAADDRRQIKQEVGLPLNGETE
jgi:Cysteine-rich CWC